MRILTLYFTRSGHTRKDAEIIHRAAGGDMAEIRTVRTYSSSYAWAVVQGGLEKMRQSLPALQPLSARPEDYDVIFLGSPVWWFTITPAMKSFLAAHPLRGKIICPFLTSGGQPKDSFLDLEKAVPEADVLEGFHIYFKGNTMKAYPEDMDRWVEDSLAEAERHLAERDGDVKSLDEAERKL